MMIYFFFFKQKAAYDMRISDWSSDVCSSDLDVYNSASLDGLFLRLQRNPPDLSAMMYTSPPDAVTLQAIYEAQRAIRGVALRTPLVDRTIVVSGKRV